jgi:hypothetical protein
LRRHLAADFLLRRQDAADTLVSYGYFLQKREKNIKTQNYVNFEKKLKKTRPVCFLNTFFVSDVQLF